MIAMPLQRAAVALAMTCLAGCAAQMDTPSPNFGQAFRAAKDAQRITTVDRDDGLRPLASELPAGVMPPGTGQAGAGQSSSWGPAGGAGRAGSSGPMILPAGR